MKGILFKPDMIKAIIEDRKTQTRRVIKPQPPAKFNGKRPNMFHNVLLFMDENDRSLGLDECYEVHPRYKFTEKLYIKEPCNVWEALHGDWMITYYEIPPGTYTPISRTAYPPEEWIRKHLVTASQEYTARTMPAWAARYFIEITDIWAQKLQAISYEQITAEGVDTGQDIHFQELWDSINKPRYDWESNPWVWVYSFTKVDNSKIPHSS